MVVLISNKLLYTFLAGLFLIFLSLAVYAVNYNQPWHDASQINNLHESFVLGTGEASSSTWNAVYGSNFLNCVNIVPADLGLTDFPSNYNVLVSADVAPAASGDSGDEAAGISVSQKSTNSFRICMHSSSYYRNGGNFHASTSSGVGTNDVIFTYTVIRV